MSTIENVILTRNHVERRGSHTGVLFQVSEVLFPQTGMRSCYTRIRRRGKILGVYWLHVCSRQFEVEIKISPSVSLSFAVLWSRRFRKNALYRAHPYTFTVCASW